MSTTASRPPNAPLDWARGVNNCGGDESMFFMMIENFEGLSFDQTMSALFESIMQMDFTGIKFNAHTLKSPLRFVSANNISPYF